MPIFPSLTQQTEAGTGGFPAKAMLIVSPMHGIKEKINIAPDSETLTKGTRYVRPRSRTIALSDRASLRGSKRWSQWRTTRRSTIEPSRYLLAIDFPTSRACLTAST